MIFSLCKQYHKLNNLPLHPGFENRLLNTEAEKKMANSISTAPTNRRISQPPKGRKRGKGRRKRRRRRNRKRKGNGRNEGFSTSSANAFDITSPSYPSISRPQPSAKYEVIAFIFVAHSFNHHNTVTLHVSCNFSYPWHNVSFFFFSGVFSFTKVRFNFFFLSLIKRPMKGILFISFFIV